MHCTVRQQMKCSHGWWEIQRRRCVWLVGWHPRSRCVMYESEAPASLHQEEDESSPRRRGLQGPQHWSNVSEAGEHSCFECEWCTFVFVSNTRVCVINDVMSAVQLVNDVTTWKIDQSYLWVLVSDIAIFVLKRDVKLQLTNYLWVLVCTRLINEWSCQSHKNSVWGWR